MAFSTTPSYTPTASAAAVTLANIYDPTLFFEDTQEAAIELNRFVQSGVMVPDARVSAIANQGGHIADIPFFKGITNDEPDYVTDNPASDSTPADLTIAKQICASAHMHKSWAVMDLAKELGTPDPVAAITGRIGKYWAVNNEKRLINTAQGIMLDNIASNGGDMVNVIHSETVAGQTADSLIDADDVLVAAATMGDHSDTLTAMAMHSVVYHNLKSAQLITTIRDADNNVEFEVYLGKYRVVVDDSLAPRAGTTDGLVYTTILFSSGVVAYGQGTPEVPSELERKASSGNGGGQNIIHSRATEIIHPYGFAWDDSAVAGVTATYAELALAAQWARVFAERKNVGMAFITSNG